MKKTMIALAVLGSVAGVAQAQSAVTIYGVMDLNLSKTTSAPTSMLNGDNNRIGFKGTEDLGGGLSAIFQAEIRMDSDTGTTEGNGTRPLFQGQTRVGLAGPFGQVRLGRGLTAVQESGAAYDPWGGVRQRGTFIPSIMDAGYISDPLNPANTTQNRFGNAVFYNTPVMSGFQGNFTVATKEDGAAAFHAAANPFSVSATYNNGPVSAMLGYERNALEDKFTQVGVAYNLGVAKLMASYAQTKFGDTGFSNAATDSKTKGWLLGANIVAGPGNVLVGYGQKKPDNVESVKQASLGYEYKLSKRTYLYTDYVNVRQSDKETKNTFDVGVHHNF